MSEAQRGITVLPGVTAHMSVEPKWVPLMSDLLDALKRSRNLLLNRGIAFATADYAIVNAERFMTAEDGSLAHPYHAHDSPAPAESQGPREKTQVDPRIYGNPDYLRGLWSRVQHVFEEKDFKAVRYLFDAEIEEMETRLPRPPAAPVEGPREPTVSPWTIVDDWMQLFDSLRYSSPDNEPLEDYQQGWNNALTVALQKCRNRAAHRCPSCSSSLRLDGTTWKCTVCTFTMPGRFA